MPFVEVCLSPALFQPPRPEQGSVVVVVDVLRATSSMLTAFRNGASAIIPLADTEVARQYQQQGYLVAGERDGKKLDFADFGNNPLSFTPELVKDKTLVFCTTNGTKAIYAARSSDMVCIGAFANFSRLCTELKRLNTHVRILCSGWNNQVSAEDTLFAGALCEVLVEKQGFLPENDSVMLAMLSWKQANPGWPVVVQQVEHYQRLLRLGMSEGLDYCFLKDTAPVMAVLDAKGVLHPA